MAFTIEEILNYKISFIFVGVFYELFFQYPSFLPHPIRVMGKIIEGGEALLLKDSDSNNIKLLKGILLGLICVFSTFVFFYYLEKLITNKYLLFFYRTFFTIAIFAGGSLFFECLKISKLIELKMINPARKALSMLVTRDTSDMDDSKICETTIETLSENLCDGVIAPLFYLFLGGIPLAMAYKMASTLDSMVGYKNEKYLFFGKFSARLDDLFNFIPARITAFLIFISSFIMGLNVSESFKAWLRDRNKTDSPNSGHPESAMAGALGISFGGKVSYFGKVYDKPMIGLKRQKPSVDLVKKAVKLSYFTVLIFLAIGFLGEYLIRRWL
ncbi:MAG: adenosylcobinamide-phosphate synthase CbiB [Proteobacteria bacterium]|nr:adenosylcobinamide-phosphate synthase CbiB [Pseudomonadota bacterium]